MPNKKNDAVKAVTILLNGGIDKNNELQEMVELASYICATPIAMINLIDRHRQHIKFKVGTHLNHLLIEDTFCQYLKPGHDVLVIPDALQDQRFYDNILVVKAPYVRFYAGVSLITESGLNIGSLCVLGIAPKVLTESQKHRLRVLAKRIVEVIQMKFSLVA